MKTEKEFSDCLKCIHHEVVEYGLIKCKRPVTFVEPKPIPQPNCKERWIRCIFYFEKVLA